MRALPSGVTPYELVMADAPTLRDIPKWGSIIWVHDTSSGKLGICANEGRWVGYDLNSDGHRVYWKERHTVTVERNVVFSKEDLPHIEDLIIEGIMDEPKGEDSEGKENEEVNLNRDKGGDTLAPVDEPERINIPAPQNLTMPEIRWSDHVKQPSQYIRDLTSGEFTMGYDKEKFPTGLQVPELEEEVTGLAMLAAMSNACGLEPRSLNVAKKSPDWPWWKEAMDEELAVLEAHNTWEMVNKPKNINIVRCHWTFVIKKDTARNIIRYKARLVA